MIDEATVLNCRCSSGCGERYVPADGVGPYIVNGDLAAVGAWPWQVTLFASGFFLCGGTILNEYWILTAAHCFESAIP